MRRLQALSQKHWDSSASVPFSFRSAEHFWEGLRSGVAAVETAGPADLDTAWGIGKAYRDQDFSIVDRTSFAVMRRLGMERAASLDDDFAIFRFGPNRRRAFTVVR
jgi:predicted nucleic acid-binding protein